MNHTLSPLHKQVSAKVGGVNVLLQFYVNKPTPGKPLGVVNVTVRTFDS